MVAASATQELYSTVALDGYPMRRRKCPMLGPAGDALMLTIGIFLLLTVSAYGWYPWCVRFWRHRKRLLAEASRELEAERRQELEEDKRVENTQESLTQRLEQKRLEGKERGRLR